MGRIGTTAEGIKTRVEAPPEMAGVDVVVDEQEDIDARVLKALERKKGLMVSLLFMGWRKVERRRKAVYTISLWGPKVLPVQVPGNDAPIKIHDAIEYITKALDMEPAEGSGPDGTTVAAAHKLEVTGCSLVPDNTWLRYAIEVETEINFR